MAQNKIIKFSETFFFKEWKQNPIIYYDYAGTDQSPSAWRKGGFEDDCILLECLGSYWHVFFMPSVKNHNAMATLDNLYHNMYQDIGFPIGEITVAKEHVDQFLIKASKLAIFL